MVFQPGSTEIRRCAALSTRHRLLLAFPCLPLLAHVHPPGFGCQTINQEIARLDAEGRLKRAELAKMVEKAEGLSKGVNGSLDQLADHMLAAPR